MTVPSSGDKRPPQSTTADIQIGRERERGWGDGVGEDGREVEKEVKRGRREEGMEIV